MRKNMGNLDKGLRIALAIGVGVLYYMGIISGTAAIILLVISVILIATSFMSFCPLYLPFGISTRRKNTE
ncbi:YgaP family membrane protein [Pedobacter suwonensis]|uniref:YgaP family membrane protein n=1 Tax=Pedobacter suwonensis TaxID=332999 RepID=UPI0036BE948F